ncbi:MAG: MBL fold metallo-hydrolase [Syntrophomonadaceae bacterium]|jgi:glyoxylase-like metal-dependent hydrolase (beta-lactamase superfamily II)
MGLRLTDNIWCLGNHLFHFFVVGQKQSVIVECGVSGAVANLRRQWPQLHPRPEVAQLLAMHAHFDHICGIPHLLEFFPQSQVTASAAACKVMQKQKIMAGFFAQDQEMVKVLMDRGYLNEAVEVPEPEAIAVHNIVGDGDKIKTADGCTLEIIATPGHSPCSIAAYMPEDKVLFISDLAGFQISDEELFPIFFQSYEMYMDSIQRMKGYPARMVGIAHGTIWSGQQMEAFYERALQTARQAFDSIREMSEAGMEHEQMANILFERYYRGDLRIYTPENIKLCVDLLIKRVQECL